MPDKPPAGMTWDQANAAIAAASTVTHHEHAPCGCTPTDFGAQSHDDEAAQAFTDHAIAQRLGHARAALNGLAHTACPTKLTKKRRAKK